MNRKLEILSRYFPYDVEVQFDKPIGEGIYRPEPETKTEKSTGILFGISKTGLIINCDGAPYFNHVEETKPILYSFEDLTKTVNGIVPAAEIAKLAIGSQGDDSEITINTETPANIRLYSRRNARYVFISRAWNVRVCYEDDNNYLAPFNQVQIHEYFIRRRFAVDLSEDEYIRKEVK